MNQKIKNPKINEIRNEIKNSKSKIENHNVLHYAARYGHLELCKFLIEKYEIGKLEFSNNIIAVTHGFKN